MKKNMLQLFFIVIAYGLLCLCSCEKEEVLCEVQQEEEQEENGVCTDTTHYLGDYFLLPESRSFFSYDSSGYISFIDLHQDTLTMKLNVSNTPNKLLIAGGSYICPADRSEKIKYTYNTEKCGATFADEKLGIRIRFSVATFLDNRKIPLEEEYDILSVGRQKIDSTLIVPHEMVVAKRNLDILPTSDFTFHAKLQILDKTFKDVYYSNKNGDAIYYHKTLGIIGFTDWDGKLWRFLDME